jgi:hypothetical protein
VAVTAAPWPMYFWPLLPFLLAGVALLGWWLLRAGEDEEEPDGRGPHRRFGQKRHPRPPGSDDGEGAG